MLYVLQLWVCEFCGKHNEVDVEREEVPTKADTTFLISPAPMVVGGAGGGVSGMEEALVVFCIDISGSMCVTTEVRVQIDECYRERELPFHF
jgi:hypothetical protein